MALQLSLSILVLTLLYISSANGQERKTCYSVNGTPDPAMSACNATAAQSSCCYSDSYCLSNGLCFGQSALYGNRLSRVGCTDASWRDPACFRNCKTGGDSGQSLWLATPELANGSFCCGPVNADSGDCLAPNGNDWKPFQLNTGYVILDRADGRISGAPGTQAAGASWSPRSSTISSSTSMTPTSTSQPSTSSSPQPSCPAPAAIPSLAASDPSCPVSKTTIPAVATGVTMGASLIAALAGLFWQWKKTKVLKRQLEKHRLELKEQHNRAVAMRQDHDFANELYGKPSIYLGGQQYEMEARRSAHELDGRAF